MGYDFSGRFRLSVILPALPAGISLAAVRRTLESPAFQGLLHELVAARLLDMAPSVALRVGENMRLATRLEFMDADAEKTMAFGEVLFDEIDRVVSELVSELDALHTRPLGELRQTAAVTLANPGSDNIKRHNQHLKRTTDFEHAIALADWEITYRTQVRVAHGHIVPPDFDRKLKIPIASPMSAVPEVVRRGSPSPIARSWSTSRVSAAELDWLGTFMDTLGDPPWISNRPALHTVRLLQDERPETALGAGRRH